MFHELIKDQNYDRIHFLCTLVNVEENFDINKNFHTKLHEFAGREGECKVWLGYSMSGKVLDGH